MSQPFNFLDGAHTEAIGPYLRYDLSRGMTLRFDDKRGTVRGGSGWESTFPLNVEPNDFGLFPSAVYAVVVDEIQQEVGAKLVAAGMGESRDAVFRVGDKLISSANLSESLLSTLLRLDALIWKWVLKSGNFDETDLKLARDGHANIVDEISYGRIDPSTLDRIIKAYQKTSFPIKEAFFIANATGIADDMRQAMSAACHHFGTLTGTLSRINQRGRIDHPDPPPAGDPWEIRHYGQAAGEVSHAYTSSIVSCYTALDLLYEFFVYLTRDPLLNPEFPGGLHFPDDHPNDVFKFGGRRWCDDASEADFPHAIPNLGRGHFASLRKSRNDLVHNLAPDEIGPRVYVGWGLPPVNEKPLQYVQYLCRDMDAQGKPVTHPWHRRFYENQHDSQDVLYEWIRHSWQCIFDTTGWLAHRLERTNEGA